MISAPAAIDVSPSAPSRRDRLALHVLQAGAVAVVLAASTYKSFELDRFFIPKELVLHLTALLGGLFIMKSFQRIQRDRVDSLLLIYLAISALSAIFATNHWVALRAFSISVSTLVVFWTARTLRANGDSKPLLSAVALAVIVGAVTSLLQTYGVETEFFSINRAPGGTLGNRNFVAHMAAFGLPIVLLGALQAKNRRAYFIRAVGATVVLAVLVLTRSRAAWLAFGGVSAIFFLAMLASRHLRTSGSAWLRLFGIALLAAAGAAAAVYSPNKLRWASANPYLESMRGVANYQEGSGRGRLIQYSRSVRMGLSHGTLGVGPGNWPVRYPKFAARRDPSMDPNEAGTTSNPWPSSDWVAYIAERGFLATVILAFAMFVIGVRALRRVFTANDKVEALHATALVATIAATVIAGAFDAVLLLGLPALLVWTTIGGLYPEPATTPDAERRVRRSPMLILALIAGVGALRSAAQMYAMSVYTNSENVTALHRAALVDPGNYRLRVRLARPGNGLKRSTRCQHANAAHELFPSAAAARSLSASCD